MSISAIVLCILCCGLGMDLIKFALFREFLREVLSGVLFLGRHEVYLSVWGGAVFGGLSDGFDFFCCDGAAFVAFHVLDVDHEVCDLLV